MMQKSFLNNDYRHVAPLFQYPGGKRKLAPWIAGYMPLSPKYYAEPFVGGGAVFWHLAKQGRIKEAFLSDLNMYVSAVYSFTKHHLPRLVEALILHERMNSKEWAIDQMRIWKQHKDMPPRDHLDVARFIYCRDISLFSKMGHHALNNKGEIRNFSAKETRFYQCNQVLQKTRIGNYHYKDLHFAEDDVVYLDPPYTGTTQPYLTRAWGEEEDRQLFEHVKKWVESGAKVYLSSVQSDLIAELYDRRPFSIAVREYNYKMSLKSNANVQEWLIYVK